MHSNIWSLFPKIAEVTAYVHTINPDTIALYVWAQQIYT